MSFVWTSRFTTKDLVYEFSRSDKVALTVTFPFIGKNLLIWLDKYTLLNDVRAIALSIYNMYVLNESQKNLNFRKVWAHFGFDFEMIFNIGLIIQFVNNLI